MLPTSSANTWRTCCSSQPISTASSSASWASSRNSARFSFSTLIFSTQETGSPLGVRQIGKSIASFSDMSSSYRLFGAALRRLALTRLFLTARLRKDHLADQVFETDRRLSIFDPPAGRDH